MGLTLTQKILQAHTDATDLTPGSLINAWLDLVLGSDVTTPIALQNMGQYKLNQVFDPDRIVLVMDHFAPNKDIQAARNVQMIREFAEAHEIRHFYDVGRMGIEHALLPEQGLVLPGDLCIGADSHTCTYGALCCFATGIGSTDMAAGMVTGQVWLRVPETIRVQLRGTLRWPASGKDVILSLINRIGVDGARYRSLEFQGPGVAGLAINDRLTICNMAIEAGAKNGIFPFDEVTRAYVDQRAKRPYTVYEADPDAVYCQEIEIDLVQQEAVIARPHLPSKVSPVRDVAGIPIQQVVIGCCTNGLIEDLRAAHAVLRGHRVHPNVRCIVVPATQSIYLQAAEEGIIQDLVRAGAAVSTPTCGPCNGGHMGVLADGERCVSTTNRNFVGRMGAQSSEVYLASPAIAAASAIAGTIALPGTATEGAPHAE